MRISLLLSFILALAVFAACQSSGPGASGPAPRDTALLASKTPMSLSAEANDDEDSAPRISLEKAKELYDSGEAVFIDTRSENSYVTEHIKGAINIPLSTIDERLKEVPKGKTIIAYCS